MPKKATQRLYLIPILSKALDIMEMLQRERGPLALETLHQRSKISKTSVYRILQTLVHRGYVSRTAGGQYRLVSQPSKVRFGFCGQSADMPFSEAVTASLRTAAASFGIDLLILDNKYDGQTALANAEELVHAGVDLIIEFQIDRRVAPIIAHKIAAASIPLIAVEIPHPNATFFGVDNFRVGFEAGECLAHFALQQWKGKVDRVLGLDLEEAGTLVQSRVTGAFEAIRTQFPELPSSAFVRSDGRGMKAKSHSVVKEFLDRYPNDRRILIAAATDTSALGALEAVRELKRTRHVAIVGQDCLPEVLEEMRRKNCALIGSVSHQAHAYGPRIFELGLALLAGKTVPPYNYVEHKLITRETAQAQGE